MNASQTNDASVPKLVAGLGVVLVAILVWAALDEQSTASASTARSDSAPKQATPSNSDVEQSPIPTTPRPTEPPQDVTAEKARAEKVRSETDPAIWHARATLDKLSLPETRQRILNDLPDVRVVVTNLTKGGPSLQEHEIQQLLSLIAPIDQQIIDTRIAQMRAKYEAVQSMVSNGEGVLHDVSDKQAYARENSRLGLDAAITDPADIKGELLSLPGPDPTKRRLVYLDERNSPQSTYALRSLVRLRRKRHVVLTQFVRSVRD